MMQLKHAKNVSKHKGCYVTMLELTRLDIGWVISHDTFSKAMYRVELCGNTSMYNSLGKLVAYSKPNGKVVLCP